MTIISAGRTCCWDIRCGLLAAGFLLCLPGCGGNVANKVVFGDITCGGERIESGSVRFVQIEDNQGPASTAQIIDSQYRIDVRGGVPIGKHRVEVEILRKTGRKVRDPLLVGGQTDERARISPDEYADERSPLQIEVTADSEGRFDFAIPRRSG